MDLREILYVTFEPMQHPGMVQKVLAFAVLLCFAWLSLRGCFREQTDKQPGLPSTVLYLASMLCLLLAFRWTAMLAPRLNPDEAQFIAAAMKLGEDPVFWRSVDINTGGPLNAYLLLLFGMMGFEINYASARFVGVLLNGCILAFLFLGIRKITTDAKARLWLLPGVLCLAGMRWFDYVHYTGALISVAFIAVLLYLWLSNVKQSLRVKDWIIWGVVAGLAPYAKLQVVPIVVALTGSLLLWQFFDPLHRSGTFVQRCVAPALWMTGIAGLLNLLIFAYLHFQGALPDMWNSYILQNLLYVDANMHSALRDKKIHPVYKFLQLAKNIPDTRYLVFMALGSTAIGSFVLLRRCFRNVPSQGISTALFVLLPLSLATAYAIIAPKTFFTHYYWYLVPVLVLWIVFAGEVVFEQVHRTVWARSILAVTALTLTCIYVGNWFLYPDPYLKDHLVSVDKVRTKVSNYLLENTPSHYRLSVWGQDPRFYAESGRIQGTRENVTHWQIRPGKLQSYFLDRFLGDLEVNTPEIFLDAVTPNRFFSDVERQSVQAFPAIASYINAHYQRLGKVDGVTFYLRNDLISGTTPSLVDKSL